ncbi:hypothetical protein EV360DRAFT_77368, partial [Lentinula raphanica]
CRASLTQFMQPLLDAVRAHTGLWLTLFIGAPPETGSEQFTLATISSGSVNGQKFQQWKSGKPLQNSIREFILYLNEALPTPLPIPDSPTPAHSTDISHLINNSSLHTIPEVNTSEPKTSASEPNTRTATKRKRRKSRKADDKGKADDDDEEEEYEDGDGDEEDYNEEDYDEDEDEDEDGDGEDGDDLPGLSAYRRQQLYPESLQYLRSLTGAARRAAIQRISLKYSKYEFLRENTVLKNKFMLNQLMERRTGSDIIANGIPSSSTTNATSTPRDRE